MLTFGFEEKYKAHSMPRVQYLTLIAAFVNVLFILFICYT